MQTLLFLAPLLAIFAPLLLGRYPGERVIARIRDDRRGRPRIVETYAHAPSPHPAWER